MTCVFEGCDRLAKTRGYCGGHYNQLWKGQELRPLIRYYYKDPERRFWDHVEKTEACWTWTGSLRPDGRGYLKKGARNVLAHRFAYELLVGPIPAGKQVDHHCRNTCCVNPEHLRIVTNKQNMENLSQSGYRTNTSGHRGVFRNGRGWAARVTHNYVNHNLGTFPTLEEAVEAVRKGRERLFTYGDGR